MKRYSKKVREEAALICAIAASNPDLRSAYCEVRRDLGLPAYARNGQPGDWRSSLERNAWLEAVSSQEPNFDAEAEALIRTGWSP